MYSTPFYMLGLNTKMLFSKKYFEDVWLGFSTTEFTSFSKLFTQFIPNPQVVELAKGGAIKFYTSVESSLFSISYFSKDLYTSANLTKNKNSVLNLFEPVFSLSRTPGRNAYQSYKDIATIFTQQATLSEILTIREYLHQKLMYKRRA